MCTNVISSNIKEKSALMELIETIRKSTFTPHSQLSKFKTRPPKNDRNVLPPKFGYVPLIRRNNIAYMTSKNISLPKNDRNVLPPKFGYVPLIRRKANTSIPVYSSQKKKNWQSIPLKHLKFYKTVVKWQTKLKDAQKKIIKSMYLYFIIRALRKYKIVDPKRIPYLIFKILQKKKPLSKKKCFEVIDKVLKEQKKDNILKEKKKDKSLKRKDIYKIYA